MKRQQRSTGGFQLGGLAVIAGMFGVVLIGLGGAHAQSSYPSKPIRILVGFAPMLGSAEDFDAFIARSVISGQR